MHVPAARQMNFKLFTPVLLGLALAGAIWVFGSLHTADYNTGLFGRAAADTLPLKSWLATLALAIAGVQLSTALWMYRKLPGVPKPPKRIGTVHRSTGVLLILVTLPVAYHCMFAYGVKTVDARVAVHSLAGAFLYGALAAKLTVVRWRRVPSWALPVAGGVLVSLVAVLWYTSALWYFNGLKLPL